MTTPLESIANTLQQGGFSYAVIGGQAVNNWLEPRFTSDIDITLVASVSDQQRLLQLLQSKNFTLEKQFGDKQVSGPDFLRFVSSDKQIILEIQIAKTQLQNDVVKRAIEGGFGLRIATPEDLIILKLIANRPKDQIDLVGLIKIDNLDWEYIRDWSEKWELEDNLQAILQK